MVFPGSLSWVRPGDEKLLAEVAQEVQPLAGVLSFQPGDLQRPGAKDVGYAWPIAVQCGRFGGLESSPTMGVVVGCNWVEVPAIVIAIICIDGD